MAAGDAAERAVLLGQGEFRRGRNCVLGQKIFEGPGFGEHEGDLLLLCRKSGSLESGL